MATVVVFDRNVHVLVAAVLCNVVLMILDGFMLLMIVLVLFTYPYIPSTLSSTVVYVNNTGTTLISSVHVYIPLY